MKKIDIQNFNKYYQNVDGNGTVARVGHVNYVIAAVSSDNAVTAIDPVASGNGVPVSTEFKVDEFVTYPSGLQGYKLTVEANLNDPAQSIYDLLLGFIKVAPGTVLELKGVTGSVVASIPAFIGNLTLSSVYSSGAEVVDVSGPSIAYLDYADAYLVANPFDPTEYILAMYAEAGVDFNAKVSLEISLGVTAGASFEYTRDV